MPLTLKPLTFLPTIKELSPAAVYAFSGSTTAKGLVISNRVPFTLKFNDKRQLLAGELGFEAIVHLKNFVACEVTSRGSCQGKLHLKEFVMI